MFEALETVRSVQYKIPCFSLFLGLQLRFACLLCNHLVELTVSPNISEMYSISAIIAMQIF